MHGILVHFSKLEGKDLIFVQNILMSVMGYSFSVFVLLWHSIRLTFALV